MNIDDILECIIYADNQNTELYNRVKKIYINYLIKQYPNIDIKKELNKYKRKIKKYRRD
jgi:hypothetical protein